MLPQAVAYNSFAIDGFPNFFLSAGPNIALANGNLILMFEKVMEYAAKCIKKMQREGIKIMVVKKEAVDDFKEYCDAFFPKTVFATKVRPSYYEVDSSVGRGTKITKRRALSLHCGLDRVSTESWRLRIQDGKIMIMSCSTGTDSHITVME